MAERFTKKEHASIYAKFRPIPPSVITDQIMKYLGEKISPPYQCVLDVGCGTGQSSLIWRPYFRNIIGCDVSPAQIEEANKRNQLENVKFIVSPSEKIPLPDNSAELISVVAALHWFDIEEFFKEAKRLLVKNGVLAVQSYHFETMLKFNTDEKTQMGKTLLKELFYDNIIEFGAPKINEDELKSVNFPFSDVVRCSGIRSSVEVTLSSAIGFLISYSPYQKFKENNPEKAEIVTKQLREKLSDLAGGEDQNIMLEQNHYLILCRNN